MSTIETSRIYVASLADYNAGRLVGAWIDLDEWLDADDIEEIIQAEVLANSKEPNAEEWAIHDKEGPLAPFIGEHTSLSDISDILDVVEEHGEVAIAALHSVGFIERTECVIATVQDGFAGAGKSSEDIVWDYYHDTVGEDALGPLADHIDWSSVVRSWEHGGTSFTEVNGTVYAFNAV